MIVERSFVIPDCAECSIRVGANDTDITVSAGKIVRKGFRDLILDDERVWPIRRAETALSISGYVAKCKATGELEVVVDVYSKEDPRADFSEYEVLWAVFSARVPPTGDVYICIHQPKSQEVRGV